jgi:hypothetical protein
MKKTGSEAPKASPCADRDWLWNAFLAADKEWNVEQDKMAKDLRGDGKINPDVKRIQAIQKKLGTSHRLFAEHVEKHGCSTSMVVDTAEVEKKSIRKKK